jgi:hypothetical protein
MTTAEEDSVYYLRIKSIFKPPPLNPLKGGAILLSSLLRGEGKGKGV